MQRRIREPKPRPRRRPHDNVERTSVGDAVSLQRPSRARRLLTRLQAEAEVIDRLLKS